MNRRFFLKNLPFFSVFAFKIQNAIGGALARLIVPPQDGSAATFVTIKSADKTASQVRIWWNNMLGYISAPQFAKSLGYHTYINEDKRKIVLYLPQNQVVVTADNAFIIVDDDTFQMPAPALWHDNQIYLPLTYAIPLLNRRTTLNLNYDEKQQAIEVTENNVNIPTVTISEKENGTVIRIRTTREFSRPDITADMRYGWLHVDFYGGKVDTNLASRTKPEGLVRKIKTFQFSELASLAFYLSKEPLSREIILKPQDDEVLVVLRTKENISEEEISELREEEPAPHEASDDLKKQLEEERNKWLIDVIIIDAGHGGKDPGTTGPGKTYEKDIVLPIALKLGKIINKEMPDVKVVYTRDKDRFIPLKRRTQIANEHNGKVFISIHANANEKKRASGFETYILGPEKGEMAQEVVLKENSVINFEDASTREEYQGINRILATMAQNAFSRQSEYLASLVQQELDHQLHSINMPNRGVKQGPFWVMVGATMPNILVETGFVSNAFDRKILKTSAYQHKIAQGIFEGFKRFKRDYESAI